MWWGILCSINLTAFRTAGSAPARATLLSALPQPLPPTSSRGGFPGPSPGGQSPAGIGSLAGSLSRWTWGLSCQETCWRQEGPSCPRGVLVLTGVCRAGGTFGKRDFISCLDVGGNPSAEPSPGGLCCVAALVPKALLCQAGNGVAVRTAGSPGGIQRPRRRAALRKGIHTGKCLKRNFGRPRAWRCQAPL